MINSVGFESDIKTEKSRANVSYNATQCITQLNSAIAYFAFCYRSLFHTTNISMQNKRKRKPRVKMGLPSSAWIPTELVSYGCMVVCVNPNGRHGCYAHNAS